MEIKARGRAAATPVGPGMARPEGRSPNRRGAVALIIITFLLVATFVFVAPSLPAAILRARSSFLSQLGAFITNSSQGGGSTSTQSFNIYSPLIQNGSANVTYPPTYGAAAVYAVSLINQDRSNYSLGAVILSPNQAGQQHADSMLHFGYFSHYDTQGYKPYMRYTLLGGVGAVFENVAYISYSNLHYTTVGTLESSLRLLEYSMMYNDSACCNNGHRINILSPLHNRVSIGIAYNTTTLFFDEDFENYYINMSVSVSKTYLVTMRGTPLSSNITSSEAFVAYENPPIVETPIQLSSGPHEYDPGTIVGGVLPPCSFACHIFEQGITIRATSWQFTSSKMSVSFYLSDFINQYGPGVYTIYLVTGSDTNSAITSFSIFVG